jgi:hypothetical protein
MPSQLLSPIMPGGPAYARYLQGFQKFTGWEGAFPSEAAGRVYLCPIDIAWPVIVDRIIYKIGAATNGNLRAGIYRQGATPDSPAGGVLMVESASIAAGVAFALQAITIVDTLLIPGQYFVALQWDNNVSTFEEIYDESLAYVFYYNRGGGYGAFTSPCPAITGHTRGVRCMLRVKTNLGL